MITSYIKDGKKFFEVFESCRDLTQKTHSKRKKNIRTEREAKEIEMKFRIELSHFKKTATIWTWERWHKEALRQIALVSKKSTVINYDGRVTRWIPKSWLERPIDSFTKSDILDVLDLISSDMEPVSQKYFLAKLKRLFEMAREDSIITINPASSIKVKERKKVQAVLTSDEVNLLLESAKASGHRFYEIWAMALKTGMRSGELYALLWSDVEFESNLIRVTKQWTNKDGITDTKTGESRVVPMSADLRKFMLELRGQKPIADFVLPHLKEWTNGMQADVLREYCNALKITPIKFHDLRATFITNLLAQGVPLVTVMAIVGHRKMATTDGYLRLAGVHVKGGTDKLSYNLPEQEGATLLKFEHKI